MIINISIYKSNLIHSFIKDNIAIKTIHNIKLILVVLMNFIIKGFRTIVFIFIGHMA